MIRYKPFYTTGSDEETELIALESTEATTRDIKRILITDYETTNGALVKAYINQDAITDGYRSKGISDSYPHILEVDKELAIGEQFIVTAQNLSAGNNSLVQGVIEYEEK